MNVTAEAANVSFEVEVPIARRRSPFVTRLSDEEVLPFRKIVPASVVTVSVARAVRRVIDVPETAVTIPLSLGPTTTTSEACSCVGSDATAP
jgi:hypothetical protein